MPSPSFTAIVVSHANPAGLRSMLGNLRYQTHPADETIAICSATPDMMRLREDFPAVEFLRSRDMGDWGHAKRARGLSLASSEWVGFFNDDDSYARDYLEQMLARTDGHDAVFCEWNENPGCFFVLGMSTAGNFIVRTAFARLAGYTSREYEADGHFIDALNARGARVVKVPELLYRHNEQAA